MNRWALRVIAIVLASAAVAGATTACSHSSSAAPPTGPAGPGSSSRLVDTFAFNVVGDTTWTIGVGEIATYLIGNGSVVNQRGQLAAFPPADVRPRLLLDTIVVNDTVSGPPPGTDLLTPSHLTFDGSGNLWMSVAGRHDSGSIVEYTRPQIHQNGRETPMVTLRGTHAPLGLVFDGQGTLWVADSSAHALLQYSGIGLMTTGPPTATISMSGISAAGATWSPVNVAVDKQGNVWVSAVPSSLPSGASADSVPSYVVAEFTAAALQGGGTPTPSLTLVQAGMHPSGYGPGLAFDPSGNLWTANAFSGSATKFASASLTPGANPSPTVTITGPNLTGIADISIDGGGVLYVGGGAFAGPGGGIFAFKASAVATSGSPNPGLSFTPSTGLNHFVVR